jgi:hypothetical protein
MTTIHFVGGEKGGVGKSVVARLLAQHFIDQDVPFTALDADGSHGALVRFYADYTRPVDLAQFESADEILTLASQGGRRVLVDLPAQSDRVLGAWIDETAALELAREAGAQVVFWHVMDDGKDSLKTLERLLERYGASAHYCIVKNMGRGRDFALFESSPVRARAEALGATIIELPELHGTAMQKMDRADASFWAAVNNSAVGNESFTRMDRQRVKVWMQAATEQLRQLGTRL